MTKDEIRNVVETFKEDNGIDKIDYVELEKAAEKEGYTLIYFSRLSNDENTDELLSALGLSLQAESSRGFTYAAGDYRLIFINEDLSESEKTIVLAHELGHILCNHMGATPVIGKDVKDEYEANEFAHFLLNPSFGDKVLGVFFRNKIAIILAALATVIIAVAVVTIMKSKFADDGSTRPYETTRVEETSADASSQDGMETTGDGDSSQTSSVSETTLANGKKTLDDFENTQTYATVKGLTEKSFESYNPVVSYDVENEIIKIVVSAPSGTSQALASKYQEIKPYWDDMCEKMRSYSEAVCDDCKKEGYYVSCAVLIVSDLDSDKCFYAALNGVQTYRVDEE